MKIINGGVCAAKGFKASGIHCGIRKNKDKRDLSLIVREAIGNAIKHGGAKKVALTADPGAGGGWLLRLANDGTPFDPATAPGAAEGHFGLEGMRQRARRLGATLSFAQRDGWTVLSLEKTEP